MQEKVSYHKYFTTISSKLNTEKEIHVLTNTDTNIDIDSITSQLQSSHFPQILPCVS